MMTSYFRLAVNNDWLLEEGWALYLQGSHFVRSGVDGLGNELQRRGISRQSQWGAQGIVYVHSLCTYSSPSYFWGSNHLTATVDTRSRYPLKRPLFALDAA